MKQRVALFVCLICASGAAVGAQPGPVLPRLSTEGVVPPAVSIAPADTVRVHLALAEAAYRSGDTERALIELKALVAIDPRHPRAQLRLGNVHHQAGRDIEAVRAYTIAAESTVSDPGEAEVRAKAHMNLALLHWEQAQRDLAQIDQEGKTALQKQGQVLAQELNQRRAPAPPTRSVKSSVPARTQASKPRPYQADAVLGDAASTRVSERSEPYTVDRWIGHAHRQGVARASARGKLTEPITESPLPLLPAVETLGRSRRVAP